MVLCNTTVPISNLSLLKSCSATSIMVIYIGKGKNEKKQFCVRLNLFLLMYSMRTGLFILNMVSVSYTISTHEDDRLLVIILWSS